MIKLPYIKKENDCRVGRNFKHGCLVVLILLSTGAFVVAKGGLVVIYCCME